MKSANLIEVCKLLKKEQSFVFFVVVVLVVLKVDRLYNFGLCNVISIYQWNTF